MNIFGKALCPIIMRRLCVFRIDVYKRQEEQYKEQVLVPVKGCEDHYLFAGKPAEGKSLLDILELNENEMCIRDSQYLKMR